MTIKKGLITAVGLGPGDAELITLKGYKAVKNADIIFYPASSVNSESITSFSLQILDQMKVNAPVKPLHIPMNTIKREQYYREAFEQIKQEYEKSLNVVVVSEGDILFYSTFGYLWRLIQEAEMNCLLIPGVPAFIAAGSLGRMPLVEGNNHILVIPCPGNFEEITQQLKPNRSLVIMKLSKLKKWDMFLENLAHPFLYVERVGTETQFVTSKAVDLAFRRIPYFSLLIIYG